MSKISQALVMNLKVWFAAALSFMVFNSVVSAQPEYILAEARYAVVKIRAEWEGAGKEDGTGFIIDSTATSLAVLTNRHVVTRKDTAIGRSKPAHKVEVIPFGKREGIRPQEIDYLHDGEDLVVLTVERSHFPRFGILTLSRRQQCDGMKVYAFTYPGEETRRTLPGIIESRDGPFYNVAFDVTKRPVWGGESGSPVLSDRGIVVGMVTEKIANEKGHTNRVLHSLRIGSELERLNMEDLPEPPEDRVLALPPLDFDPPFRQREWSHEFITKLKEFFAACPDIRTVSEGDLEYHSYRKHQRQNDALGRDDYYRMPSHLVVGWCKKDGKGFQLDILLELFPGEEVVWSKRLGANSLSNLADSTGVHLARYFGYKTKFDGVPDGWRKWSLRTTLAGILPAVLLWRAAANDKNDYEKALKRHDTENLYDSLHRNEILRNSATIATGVSLGFWINAALLDPRKPKFQKLR